MKKKLLSMLLVTALLAAMAVPALADETPNYDHLIMPLDQEETATESGKIVVLHTNDVHCGVDPKEEDGTLSNMGYAGVAAYKAQMEARYGASNVTLVDAGDAIQGGNIGTVSKGGYLVDIMNRVGYDLAVPGNHEFDYGMDNFLTLARERAQFPYVCANFVDAGGKSVFEPYVILTYGDTKVAYVGIDTPEAFTKSTPAYFQNEAGEYIYGFCEGNEGAELYHAVQEAVDAARKDGADYVVAVGHLGQEGTTAAWTSKAVAENTTGIDVFIDGHSHEDYSQQVKSKDGKSVLIEQTGTKLENIGKIVIDTATGEITGTVVPAREAGQGDEAVAQYISGINAEFDAQMKKVIATSEVELTTRDANGDRLVRKGETNLGDLCADAYRAITGADIGLMNGGGIRADIKAGEVTMGDILNVYTFGNEVCLAQVTGQQLLDALEFGARNYPEENGGFLHVSGLSYTIDPSVTPSITVTDKREFVSVDGPYRVKDVLVDGKPLELTATYTVGSHNYMLVNGGDGYAMFGKNITILRPGIMVDNAGLVQYITQELGGKITARDYGQAQGRITFAAAAPAQPMWYDQAVKTVTEQGIMKGTGNGFEPDGVVTRATVFQALYNLSGAPEQENRMITFPDAQGKWYEKAARWAEQVEVTNGTGAGLFEGERNITRQELVTILHRYVRQRGVDVSLGENVNLLAGYLDAELVSVWALEPIQWAVGSGVVAGKTTGAGLTLAPEATATRAELAQVLTNIAGFFPQAA